MNPTESNAGVQGTLPGDELLQLELSIAQRADALAQQDGYDRGRDLEHWLQAEHEVFARNHARALNASAAS
jgi:hypothetical protein